MCGIAGFNNHSGLPFKIESLVGMLNAIRHRGPDALGIYIDDYVALGHVRLSIIDLSSGNQPIHNENKTIWITYNGEIYNYPELRAYLEKKGHCFTTMTDTEILVHLYEEDGVKFLEKLNGQWAFALWDSTRKRLFLARDRLGVRPLYYTACNGTFIFASEIKSLFTLPQIPKSIDPIALDQLFTFWTTLHERTAFQNINELKPGHFLVVDHTGTTIQKYWDIPLYNRDNWLGDDSDQITEQIQNLLVDAVRIRLRADVPVGTYLSGGLDSSGITSIVASRFNSDVQTFGIRFEDTHFDEGSHQLEMVRFLNVKHHELKIADAEIGNFFLQTVNHCEKPLLRTAPVPLFLLSKLVRESGIKVVLTGEGADEFHAGYDIFKEALIRRFWARQPDSSWRGRLIERLYPDIFRDDRTKKITGAFFRRNIRHFDDPLYSHLIRWDNTARLKAFFSKDLVYAIGSYNGLDDCRRQLPENFHLLPTLNKAQFLEISIFLSNYLLSSQGDRMGMAHSIEVRMPFLDFRLIDLMGRVPPWIKMRGLQEKFILKKALQPFLPPSITARVKHPYRAPVHKSLISLWQSASGRDLLSAEKLRENAFFDARKVELLIDKLSTAGSASEMEAMALAGIISTQYIGSEFMRYKPVSFETSAAPNVLVDKRSSR